jgi:P-type Cu+ transporter
VLMASPKNIQYSCAHCGDKCDNSIALPQLITDNSQLATNLYFCCHGCKQVYQLLNESGMCDYYTIDKTPGIKAKGKFVSGRFGYLDDQAVQNKLISFTNGSQTHVTFYLPQIHCSSCIWLLENLNRINTGVISSRTDFHKKEVFIILDPSNISIRQTVELLAFIGYEPYISLNDVSGKKKKKVNRREILKIGVAGFCFGNIMMLSFPEYFSSGDIDQGLRQTFTYANLALSLPVFFFCAAGFFTSAWNGIKQKFLNIDAPIAVALLLTFSRSVYKILSHSGPGFLDSLSGIVFFMLLGRWFQNKTYDSFSFDRDYLSYFPLGVSVINEGVEKNVPITQLKKGDTIIIRNGEMIPADAVLEKGSANIDYSFVTGENNPVQKSLNDLLYAGGKQVGSAITLRVINEVSQSHLTQLWNNDAFVKENNKDHSFIHPWSRYFTAVLFSIAVVTAVYWYFVNTSTLLPAVTAILIVACPCSLLLSATFTYGNILRIFGKNKFYLKNASVIENIASADTIVFDKTGTLTETRLSNIHYTGEALTKQELAFVKGLTANSSHPLSKMIHEYLPEEEEADAEDFAELPGQGITATMNEKRIKLGSAMFVNSPSPATGTGVHVSIDNKQKGSFTIDVTYRKGVRRAIKILQNNYKIYLLSGDNNSERGHLRDVFHRSNMYFNQLPQDKLNFIQKLQRKGRKVIMIGDGLNDAGALKQSDAGIAVTENTGQFSPACDAILASEKLNNLHKLISYARSGKTIVTISFIISILYNFVGLSFAVRGALSPLIAAILMPISSITIVLFVTAASSIQAKLKGL